MTLFLLGTALLNTAHSPKTEVGGATMTFGTLCELSCKFEKELGRKIDIVTNSPDHMRPAFYKSIKQNEERLYEAK